MTPTGLARRIAPTSSEIRYASAHLRIKALAIVAAAAVSYWFLVVADVGPLVRAGSAVALLVAIVGIATSIQHDANHGAFARSTRRNNLVGYSLDLLGGSSWLWRVKHNLHHGNTNIDGVDSDIEQMPFARLAPGQPWRKWHRYQHLYMWGLYGVLSISWFVFADFFNLLRRRIGSQPFHRRPRSTEVVTTMLGKLLHLTWAVLIPLMFHPWWIVLAVYLAMGWALGFILAIIFQLAHCVDRADFVALGESQRGADFEQHTLRTTVDVHCRVPVLRGLMGGLDHQVVHHLFPSLPHTIYPKLTRRLARVCDEHEFDYRFHPSFWSGLRSHARWLKAMGQQPENQLSAV